LSGWSADHLTWPGGQALWQYHISHIGYPSCRLKLTRVEDGFQKYAKPWSTGQGIGADRPHLGSAGPGLCATSSPYVILSVTTPNFRHNEDMYRF
jgi:hypothetical protein